MIIDAIHLYTAEEVGTSAASVAQFSLNQADLSQSYILEAADGLDLDTIVPQFYGGYSTDRFYDMSLPNRDVTLKIKLNPQHGSGETPSSLRDTLSKAIARSRTGLVELRFMLGATNISYLQGFITKFEAAIFSADPEVRIKIECNYPLLRGLNDIQLAGTAGVTIPSPTLIDNLSTAPHGFKMVLAFTGTVSTNFVIQGKYGSVAWPFTIIRNVGNQFINGDQLWISSEQNNKYVYMIRGGVTTYLIDTVGQGSVWPIMFPGSTRLTFSTSLLTISSIIYRNHYWGV